MSHKIGLALGNGGSRGLAHIGVLKCLIDNRIPIDYIAGTSAGALIGGFYAATQDINLITDLVEKINYKKLLSILVGPPSLGGVINSQKIEKFIIDNIGDHQIENLPVKFAAVSVDLVSGKKVIFKSGSLARAIRCSVAIPGIFSPVNIDDKILIDGGATEPVPVETVKKLGADKIIAVGLYDKLFPRQDITKSSPNMAKVTYLSIQLTVSNLAKEDLKAADVVIMPPLEDINMLDFVKAKKFIDIGYQSTLKKIPEIKKLNSA